MVFIYILQLENKKYYIGKTSNPDFRLGQHFNSSGSQWTKKYKPYKVIEIIPNCDNFDEDKHTLKFMEKYGINNVRGGTFCELKLNKDNIETIKKMINGSTDKCYICGENGHFAKDCNDECNYENVWICEYCDKEFTDENKCQLHDNKCKLEHVDKLKIKFIDICKKYDKINNNIIQASEIIDALKIIDKTFDFKLTNIYGFCQTINKCNSLKPIISYRDGINYIDFIDGLLYIINNNPIICKKCDQENCYCENKSKTFNKNKCTRCGRSGHYSNECYAKKNINKEEISESSEEEIEVFCCSYCDKEFDTLKGATCHENLYCKNKNNKNNKNNKTKSKQKNIYYSCGRRSLYN